MKPSTRAFVLGVVAGGVGTVVVAVIAAVVGAKLYARHVEATLDERVKAPTVPESLDADYSWVAVSLDGTPFSGTALEGQTAVVSIWKPDCFSCTEQLEYLQSLYGRMQDAPVAFAGVSVGDVEETRAAIADMGLTLPIYVLRSERPKVYATSTLPTTFVLSAHGKVAYRHGGIARWDDPAVESYLRELASQSVLAD